MGVKAFSRHQKRSGNSNQWDLLCYCWVPISQEQIIYLENSEDQQGSSQLRPVGFQDVSRLAPPRRSAPDFLRASKKLERQSVEK